jgi:hypothetical protein
VTRKIEWRMAWANATNDNTKMKGEKKRVRVARRFTSGENEHAKMMK